MRQTKLLGNELLASPLWGDSLSVPSRWLFICLLLKTDDEGQICVDHDFRVCSEISGMGIQSSQRALNELQREGLVTAYDDDTVVVHRASLYRQRQTHAQAQSAERMRRWRQRNGDASVEKTPPTPPSITVHSTSTSTVQETRQPKWAKRPEGVDPEVWDEFVALRRKRKATVTERVLRGLEKQAKLAGITLQEAMETCVDRGWATIKAEWLNKDGKTTYKGDISEAGEIDF